MLFDSDHDYAVHKFFCDCGMDTYEIFQDKKADGTVLCTSIQLNPARGCSNGLWVRLKRAFKYVFGMESEPWYDVIVRPEDIDELVEILKKGKGNA